MHVASPRSEKQSLSPRRIVSAAIAGLLMVALGGGIRSAGAAEAAQTYLGGWDLTLPGGGAGWLGVTEKDGQLHATILWGGGSVLPAESVKVEGDQLLLTRVLAKPQKSTNGKIVKPATTQLITARATGDLLKLTLSELRDGKAAVGKAPVEFSGKRTPPLPPAPDLSKVKFGPPQVLFNGKDLTGWRLTNPHQVNGWSVQDGLLVNRIAQEAGKPHKSFGNLRTEQEFGNFNLTLETRVPKNGNSGVYLHGIYEVQVVDSYGHPLDPHNMGAIYSRICPTVLAEKPAGQWQTLDITLVDRHATVILNGTKIVDNQPLLGCTGGALVGPAPSRTDLFAGRSHGHRVSQHRHPADADAVKKSVVGRSCSGSEPGRVGPDGVGSREAS